MLGRVRAALGDLVGDLVDRTLALRQHIHDLGTTAIPERLRDRREKHRRGGPWRHGGLIPSRYRLND